MAGPSHSALLLALLLCAVVQRASPNPRPCLNATNEFDKELKELEEEVKNCPEDSTSTDTKCQCIKITKQEDTVLDCTQGYFTDGLDKMIKIPKSFEAASDLIVRVERWCLEDYSSVSTCEAVISPKLFLDKLRTLYQASNSR